MCVPLDEYVFTSNFGSYLGGELPSYMGNVSKNFDLDLGLKET